MNYYKRLIEVDFPVKKASASGRKEKDIRSGHPWQLHIWWARRPWGVCRAVALASLLPAPTDKLCPKRFLEDAPGILSELYDPRDLDSPEKLQNRLLHLVGEISVWEQGTNIKMIDTARKLVKLLYPDGSIAFDPFSGYGAIPGEAARLGCHSYAFDLNPVAVLCMKTILEDIPKYKEEMIDLYLEGTEFIKAEAVKRLSQYYPEHDGKRPIAWLWARTVKCEGPLCGAEIPLISQTVIAKGKTKTWVEIKGDPNTKLVDIDIKTGNNLPLDLIKTAGGGHALCPVCNFLTNKERVKAQAKNGHMGHRLFGIALPASERQGKKYINATEKEINAFENAKEAFEQYPADIFTKGLPELFPMTYGLHVPPHYGISTWGDIFSPRQKLALLTLDDILHTYFETLKTKTSNSRLSKSVITALSLSISNIVHYSTNMSTWLSEGMISCFIAGNAIAMRWDWAEANPLVPKYAGGIDFSFSKGVQALKSLHAKHPSSVTVAQKNATDNSLPTDSSDLFFTDPPYYDVVPYADLSDLPYVWLKRFLKGIEFDLFDSELTPKAEQIVVNPYKVDDGRGEQTPEMYQKRMTIAFAEARRVLRPDGIGAIVFAHKGTEAWETLLASVLDAGFVITGSWPIDTERGARMRANNSAALSSSIHLIVRPREHPDGRLITDRVGDWSDVIGELPKKLKDWMPRLASEGIIGADAIFACLGPALEIFSQYSSVEKPNGDVVTLKEYLEKVWGAISQVALDMVFMGGNAEGFEEDARLTAMWLWTLRSSDGAIDSEDGTGGSPQFALDYGTVHKITVGLGIEVENLKTVVEIKGDTARLYSVKERAEYLFSGADVASGRRTSSTKLEELNLFEDLLSEPDSKIDGYNITDEVMRLGDTILNRLHQAMLLFAQGKTGTLKKFLVEREVGKDENFWKLAQALNALYPAHSDERRWVEAVQAYKKNLGF